MSEVLDRAKDELTRHPRRALELASGAWQSLGSDGDPADVLECRLCLGWANHYLSLAGEALVHFKDAQDAAAKHGLPFYEVRARTGVGAVFRQLGRFDSALDQLSQAWRLAETLGDEQGSIQASILIADVNLALDHPEDALEGLSRARNQAQASPRRGELVDVLLALGQTSLHLKRNRDALEQLSRALVLSQEVGNRIGESRALILLGLVYRDAGELEIGEEYYLECLRLCQTLDHPWGQLDAYYHLGDLHALRGFHALALKHFEKVVALAETLDAQSHLVRVELRMAALWEASGDLPRALEATKSALERERRIKADEASRNVRSLEQLRSLRLEAESVELKKALDSLRVISELGRRITSSLTVSALFQTLYESLAQIFALPGFGLALYDPEDGSMRTPFRIDHGVRLPPQGRIPMGLTLAGWALRHRTTVLIRDVEVEGTRYLDPGDLEDFFRRERFRSAVFLPLFAGDKPIGTVTLQSDREGAFDQVHANFLDTLSGYIVVALTNALSHRKVRRLNKQILRLAQFDSLTGLANRRLLADSLKRTVAQAQRKHRRFALFFLDLDGFKPINDQWGHAAGDFVLARLGKRLAGSLRESDLVARVGGDEFVALATEIDGRASIVAIAEKLSRAITDPLDWNGQSLSIGVSIGIALYPDSATDADALLNRADAAMYLVKARGKNSWAFADDSEPTTDLSI